MAPSQKKKGKLKEDGADAATMAERKSARDGMAACKARKAGDPNAPPLLRKPGRKPSKK